MSEVDWHSPFFQLERTNLLSSTYRKCGLEPVPGSGVAWRVKNVSKGPKSTAPVNELLEDGSTQLMDAIADDDGALVELLLNDGADPNLANESGMTPIFLAAKGNQCLDVRALVQAKADPHARIDAMGATPLYIACHHGHADCVEEMCFGGAQVDLRMRDGSTALHVGAKGMHAEVVRVLLEAKASPDAQSNKGFTPLHSACGRACNNPKDSAAVAQIARLLIAASCDVDIMDKEGTTPLRTAIDAQCATEVVSLLLGASADADARDLTTGDTPMLRAIGAGRFGVVRALLTAGADVKRANANGVTPLRLAYTVLRSTADEQAAQQAASSGNLNVAMESDDVADVQAAMMASVMSDFAGESVVTILTATL